jgi:hypothetical protein
LLKVAVREGEHRVAPFRSQNERDRSALPLWAEGGDYLSDHADWRLELVNSYFSNALTFIVETELARSSDL